MATELTKNDIRVLSGESVGFDGLDGPPNPKLIEEVQAAQKRVDEAAVRIHDKSPEAITRRRPFVLENLANVLKGFGPEHPFYLRRLSDATKGGYLPEPAPFKEVSARFRTMADIKEPIAV